MAQTKTNAMRILDSLGIKYETHHYEYNDGTIDGVSVAKKINKPVEQVYKTLVTQGTSKEYYVFVIPVSQELNLKAAAKSVGEKSVEMIKVSDILKITGYIRGGCSPVGMKKRYQTIIDSSCKEQDTIIVSAGKIGQQIELEPQNLISAVNGRIEKISF